MNKSFDTGSILVILITFLLFASALFVKGFTHDLLLEAGVLLVSIKLIIMAYKTSTYHQDVKKELQEIKELLNK
jgi:hypothetical protein